MMFVIFIWIAIPSDVALVWTDTSGACFLNVNVEPLALGRDCWDASEDRIRLFRDR